MIFGWKNNPHWVKYYEERQEKRQEYLALTHKLNIQLQRTREQFCDYVPGNIKIRYYEN